jgi:NADH:ubiquinone oxidoreductase subunit 6 (subunit J)
MNKKNDIDIKVEAAMNSLDGIGTATPGAFFFTRVQARLNRTEKSVWEKVSSFIARPAIAVTVVLAVVLMNAIAVIQQETSSSLVEQSEQSVYEDFNVAANTFYEYEISEP